MHRPIQSQVGRMVGRSPASEDELAAKAAVAYRMGRGVYFSPSALEGMPWQSRELIMAEAERVYGAGSGTSAKGGGHE
ncbi:MAG TPA: hypothetical protein VEY95_11980 [Azospirillaceae bacterium]|nr:hypothetical protein [Azospirillaceae bacterium]